jgi:CheY-like chemotaxis protein
MDEKRVYIVTLKGNAELTGGKTSLTAAELELLVLIDGIATVEQIAKRIPLDAAAAATMLAKLAKDGYVGDPDATAALTVRAFLKESETGLASLQAKGFFVRIARRRPDRAASGADEKLTVLVVEDDAALAKLLRTYLQMEDFEVRTAATREEITKALREPPKPDIVLLDVMLPDIDGFDVLVKMRQHEALKDVPVIVTTAKATRESVLIGLQRGADGYVTKPYDMPLLLHAMYMVLGLPKRANGAWSGPA